MQPQRSKRGGGEVKGFLNNFRKTVILAGGAFPNRIHQLKGIKRELWSRFQNLFILKYTITDGGYTIRDGGSTAL